MRPDFIDRCKPINNVCTGVAASIKSGMESFPSGHSSTAFFGLGFFAIWIIFENHLFPATRKWKSAKNFCALGVIYVAMFIAISRTQQFVHHPTDVIAGAILGLLMAFLFYFHHYI